MAVVVTLEKRPCPLGCPPDDVALLTAHDLQHDLPGSFTVVRCRTCGLMRTDPRPTQDTIGVFYPDHYGPYLGTEVRHRQPGRMSGIRKFLGPIARRIFNFKTDALPNMPRGRMIEVGSASGAFLHRMAGKGWTVEGIEFSPKAAQAATALGYRVHAGPLESAPDPDGPVDLIVGLMVLEHLHDPVGGLRKLRRWATSDAWLVLSTPNAGSFERRFFKERWYALQVPNHLYHFTPDSLRKVLEAGGWTLERVHHQRLVSNLVGSVGYVLRDRGYTALGQHLIDLPKRATLWPHVLFPLAWILSLFGQTGRMTVWARVTRGSADA